MATILYARVSTTEQTLGHQVQQAEAAGFHLDDVVADHGVSGTAVKMRDRPEGRRLFDMLRAGDTLVVRWVDRLGRNYEDVTATIQEFIRRGVTIRTVINNMTFDGQPQDAIQKAVRDALIAFMAATAQAQAEATKEAQRAGIASAKADPEKNAYMGRKPKFTWNEVQMVRDLLSKETPISEISKVVGLPRPTIYRIKDHPADTDALLAKWDMIPRGRARATTIEEDEEV